MRWVFGIAGALVLALIISLIVRPVGSYVPLVDGWGVDELELTMGAVCLACYFEGSWRANTSVARVFPLVIGVACLSWGIGDVVLTIESLGGATPPVPSFADAFYILFFPLSFVVFAIVIRRGNQGSLAETSLDGLVAALAAASVSTTFVVTEVLRLTGGSDLGAATNLVYPLGDVLLLALAVGGLSLDDGAGETLSQIVSEYVRVTTEGCGDLLRELDEGDSGALECTAHTLKGASANVRASGMADLCAGLELRARHAQLDDAAELMERFEAEFARVRVGPPAGGGRERMTCVS